MNGKLAVDTNAVIAYREAIPQVCTLIDSTVSIFLPAIVLGELLYGANNSAKPEKNDIWIAALCLGQNVPLLSNDGHFDKINGLEVINWQ